LLKLIFKSKIEFRCIQVLVNKQLLRTSDKIYTTTNAFVDIFFNVIGKELRNKHCYN